MSKVKILITGGTGFLGYHLAKKCLKRNWIVHSLSTKKPNKIRKIKKVKYLTCDISKNYLLKKKINELNIENFNNNFSATELINNLL